MERLWGIGITTTVIIGIIAGGGAGTGIIIGTTTIITITIRRGKKARRRAMPPPRPPAVRQPLRLRLPPPRAQRPLNLDRTMNTKILCVSALLLTTAWFCGAAPNTNRELNHLPPAVRKGIHAKLGKARLVSVEKDDEDGEVTYDVEMVKDGKNRTFTVDGEGTLVDEQVFLEELSGPVQKTITHESAGQTIAEIDKSVDDDLTSYEVQETRAGVTRSFVVDGDGILLQTQVFLTELPAAVRQTIQKQASGATLGDINRSNDDDTVNYTAEVTKNGNTREFTVDAQGKLVSMEMSLADLPDAVQAAVKKTIGNAEPDEIEKTFEDGETNYDVDANGKTYSFDSTGELFSTEEDITLADAPAPVQEQIKTLMAGGKLSGLSKITEDGEVSFDVDMLVDGADKSATLSPDGKVLPDE